MYKKYTLFRFEVAAVIGGRQFPAVQCNNKKDGRTEAADTALRMLMAEDEIGAALVVTAFKATFIFFVVANVLTAF